MSKCKISPQTLKEPEKFLGKGEEDVEERLGARKRGGAVLKKSNQM